MILNCIPVAIGGCFGAIARFGVSQWMSRRRPSNFPYATLIVNLLGSLLLGILFGLGWDSSWELIFGTGFMGAFTTFSTFKLENIQLHLKKEWNVFAVYIGTSYIGGILLAFCGIYFGSQF